MLCATAASASAQGTAGVSSAIARSIPGAPDPRHVFVFDSAHLFTEAQIAAMQDSAVALQAATGSDVAFVTLPTLHGGAVEEAALAIGRQWKIGSAGAPGDPTRNRGLVMLYVLDKKGVAGGNLRVEVGQGLEGAITDGGGSRAILEAMKPDLRAKRYGDGFLAGFSVASRLVRTERPRTVASTPAPVQADDTGVTVGIVVILLLFLAAFVAIVVSMVRAARRAALAAPPTMVFYPSDDSYPPRPADGGGPEVGSWGGSSSSDSSSSSSSSSDSGGGSFGGGGGFSGGGASDSV